MCYFDFEEKRAKAHSDGAKPSRNNNSANERYQMRAPELVEHADLFQELSLVCLVVKLFDADLLAAPHSTEHDARRAASDGRMKERKLVVIQLGRWLCNNAEHKRRGCRDILSFE